jgi:hypothetical protein
MAENRTPRELQTRDQSVRKRSWQRADLLPNPNPEAGYEYRWIRVSTMGQDDPRNVSAKLREGWEPVLAAAHPEVHMMASRSEEFKDNIMVGGLMLCKTPTEMVQERNAYFNEQAQAQITSVDNNLMRQNDPRMPLFNERKTKVTFGKGT